MPMPPWRAFLAPVAVFSLFTVLRTVEIAWNDADFVSGNTSADFVAGSGAPPLAAAAESEYGPQKGGHLEAGTPSDEGEERKGEESDDDDDDGDPRLRKNPKGTRWRGRPESRQDSAHNTTNNNARDRESENSSSDNNQWWRRSRQCFEVDAICHRRDGNEWFYHTPSESKRPSATRSTLFQPTMELKSAPAKYDGASDSDEPRISVKVVASSEVEPEEIENTCHVSPTPTHVVLQSLFNDMIGEFYSRTVLKLYRFMTVWAAQKRAAENGDRAKLPWEEDIQFYVHIPYGNKKMLDGHRLLLSGMLSNPNSPVAKSFIELFAQEEAADSNGSAGCECYEKVVFCGYDIYTHSSDVESKDLEPARDDDDDRAIAAETTDDTDIKYTLWSAGKLDTSFDSRYGSCGRNAGKAEYECREWNQLRYFMSMNFVKHYPTLEADIVRRRRRQLLEQGAIDESYQGDTREFTVAGLTQRTYRRAWLNLPSILEECNAAPLERVLCVEINVENTSTPYEQLLLHRSLDVMIGVHGAQLTQAVLLPQHAHILEILPWVPGYVRGRWVQTTHLPTPLGVIFHNTDLNHVGYSLDRSSVPLCEGVDESAEQTCFLRQRKKFIWENRDFNVESNAVMHYIEKMVLVGREKNLTCEELQQNTPEKFVLYNVWCSKLSRWHLGLRDRKDACVYGTGYQGDSPLFDTRDECCKAFSRACRKEPESKEEHQNSSTGEMALFHAYRREFVSRSKQIALQKDKEKEEKKRKAMEKEKRKARRKKRKTRAESDAKDQRNLEGNKLIPLHNGEEGSSGEVADRAAQFTESEQERKERRARRRKRNRKKQRIGDVYSAEHG